MAKLSPTEFFLQVKQGSDPGLVEKFSEIEDLYTRKLWHQLTLKLLEIVTIQELKGSEILLSLYRSVVADVEHRISSLALAELAAAVAHLISDSSEAIAFFEKVKERVEKSKSQEALLLCWTSIGQIHLKQNQLEDCKEAIKKAQAVLDSIDGVSTVHNRFYMLASKYEQTKGNYANYYAEALRFLGCTDIGKTLTLAERREWAFTLCVAAMLGEGVYNFGELLGHEILDSLRETEQQWIIFLLEAFNSGNIAEFERLGQYWRAQSDLLTHEAFLFEKIRLLCLMEMTFRRPANQRQLTFAEISKETRLPLPEVELLVMRALSLNLVRGSIDEVEASVQLTWVQPRVLNLDQIRAMSEKFGLWVEQVKGVENLMEVKSGDLLTL